MTKGSVQIGLVAEFLNARFESLEQELRSMVGRGVRIGDQEFMLVRVDSDFAYFENEDERIVKKNLPAAERMFAGILSRNLGRENV